MKNKEYKSCKRKKCPYYSYVDCPKKYECKHSKELRWSK